MNIKEVKELIDLFEAADVTELEYEHEGFRLRLKKSGTIENVFFSPGQHVQAGAGMTGIPPAPVAAPPQAPPQAAPKGGAATDADQYIEIVSPMVGVFYRASSPDAPPFVDVGDKVESNTTVCIVEAMKIMNEIKAEITGTVVEALVANGHPVEYGQPLFRVKPA